jgi:hypothetical protein
MSHFLACLAISFQDFTLVARVSFRRVLASLQRGSHDVVRFRWQSNKTIVHCRIPKYHLSRSSRYLVLLVNEPLGLRILRKRVLMLLRLVSVEISAGEPKVTPTVIATLRVASEAIHSNWHPRQPHTNHHAIHIIWSVWHSQNARIGPRHIFSILNEHNRFP